MMAKKAKKAKSKPKKKVRWLPKGMQSVIPYLLVADGAQELAFMVKGLDAEEDHVSRDESGAVMHATVFIGKCAVMMGQTRPPWEPKPAAVYMYVKDCDAAHKRALAAGATEIMPPNDTFYGDRNSGVTDPSGIQWWFATHIKDVSNKEIERKAKEIRKKQQK